MKADTFQPRESDTGRIGREGPGIIDRDSPRRTSDADIIELPGRICEKGRGSETDSKFRVFGLPVLLSCRVRQEQPGSFSPLCRRGERDGESLPSI